MKQVLTIVIYLTSTLALAGGGQDHMPQGGGTNNNIYNEQSVNVATKANANSYSNSRSNAYSNSSSLGIGTGGSAIASGSGGLATSTGQAGNNTLNGGTTSTSVVTGGTNFNQVRQTPFAYSPAITLGYNPYKCKDSVSLGVSAGFGAIGGGMPVGDDTCELLVKADYLVTKGYTRESCLMLLKDPDMQDVFRQTGNACRAIVVTPAAREYIPPRFIDPDAGYKLDSIYQHKMLK